METFINYAVTIAFAYFVIKLFFYLAARIRFEREIEDYCSKRSIPIRSQYHKIKMYFEPFWPLVLDPRKWLYRHFTGWRTHQW